MQRISFHLQHELYNKAKLQLTSPTLVYPNFNRGKSKNFEKLLKNENRTRGASVLLEKADSRLETLLSNDLNLSFICTHENKHEKDTN